MREVAKRISDGAVLALIKAWLSAPVQGLYAFSKTALGKRGAVRSRIMARTYGSILVMKEDDDFSRYFGDALEGRYDCVDRIVVNGYFPRGHSGGGFRTW
jgi:hypothetical protein